MSREQCTRSSDENSVKEKWKVVKSVLSEGNSHRYLDSVIREDVSLKVHS